MSATVELALEDADLDNMPEIVTGRIIAGASQDDITALHAASPGVPMWITSTMVQYSVNLAPNDGRPMCGHRVGGGLLNLLPVLRLQFYDSQVQPFHFLDGEKMNFPQKLDDLGLGVVHEWIMGGSSRRGVPGSEARCCELLAQLAASRNNVRGFVFLTFSLDFCAFSSAALSTCALAVRR
jgi:hypothetical protein